MCDLRRTRVAGFIFALAIAPTASAIAQVDFSGHWGVRQYEDQEDRAPGGEPGDFTGIPLTEPARFKALSWDAAQYGQKEYQCRPHAANFIFRSVHPVRIYKDLDPVTGETIAFHANFRDLVDRVVYLDGRPHPPEEAAHTWGGFSTGKWEGDVLNVTVTHIKEYLIRRDGAPLSDKAEIHERWIRHGDVLTIVQILYDVYLSEPYIISTDYLYDPRLQNDPPQLCEIEEESDAPRGWVPHHLPGTNHDNEEYAAKHGMPVEAARGGAETAYPDFRKKMATMKPAEGK